MKESASKKEELLKEIKENVAYSQATNIPLDLLRDNLAKLPPK